jgi:hypothetical protein
MRTVTASTEVVVGDLDAEHVLIRPLFRSQPDLFDIRDDNWIDCEVQVVAGGFRGGFRSDLRSEELQSFSEETEALRRTLDGTATLSTVNGQIVLSLTVGGAGRVRVAGEAIDGADGGNRLQFSFEIDQARVPAICESLASLLAAYPVTGAPDAEQA